MATITLAIQIDRFRDSEGRPLRHMHEQIELKSRLTCISPCLIDLTVAPASPASHPACIHAMPHIAWCFRAGARLDFVIAVQIIYFVPWSLPFPSCCISIDEWGLFHESQYARKSLIFLMKEVGGERSLYWSWPVFLGLNLTQSGTPIGEGRSDYGKLDRRATSK